MKTRPSSSPALKHYCVWADYVRRVYQHVDADSPRSAMALAKAAGAWEPCETDDHNNYRASNEVQDLETDEFIAVDGQGHCKTCRSEIVATVNDSLFREGECNVCECQRYHSQPELLEACQTALEELHCPDGDDEECGAIAALRDAIAQASDKPPIARVATQA